MKTNLSIMETPPAPSRSARKPRLSRAEKAEATRAALFDAAIEIVGEHGYAGASVALITTRANVAQGTFYNYF
jgi:AcrR family transcriptional regulator